MQAIQNRTSDKMHDGAVAGAYAVDRKRVIEVLNEVLASEFICNYGYHDHYKMASGMNAELQHRSFLTKTS